MIFLKRNAPPEYGKSGLYTMLNFKSQQFLLPLPSQVSKLEVCRKVSCYFGRTWLISSSIALELTHWTGLIGFQPFFLPKHTFLWNPIISYLKIRSVWSRKRGTNRLSEFQKSHFQIGSDTLANKVSAREILIFAIIFQCLKSWLLFRVEKTCGMTWPIIITWYSNENEHSRVAYLIS